MNRIIQEYNNVETHRQLPPELVQGIEECIDSAFGGSITQEDARQHMSGDQLLLAISGDEKKVQGFSASKLAVAEKEFQDLKLSSKPGVYLAGTAIALCHQGEGLYDFFNKSRIVFGIEKGAEVVFTRTQNPKVQKGITKTIEQMIREGSISDYALSRIVREGIYGKMLTAKKPTGRGIDFEDIDYERGDAVIITWDLVF